MRSYASSWRIRACLSLWYHNNRDGPLPMSVRIWFGKLVGRALGVVAIDVNNDG